MKKSIQDSNILKIFNYLGGALIFFGIMFFISINWASLNDFLRIFLTLGIAVAAFVIGIFLMLDERDAASAAFFMIAGLVLPMGLYVTFRIYDITFNMHAVNLMVSMICFAVFLLGFLFFKKTILLLFSFIFGSFFFASTIEFIVQLSNVIPTDLLAYDFIALGISYILFGYYLDLEKKYPLTGPLYFFGGLFILSTSYWLGGSFYFNLSFPAWKIMTAIFILLSFFLAVPLKSKSLLYLGTIFLVLYITDISYKFAKIFGDFKWPLILILVGFLLMIVGYILIALHRKMTR